MQSWKVFPGLPRLRSNRLTRFEVTSQASCLVEYFNSSTFILWELNATNHQGRGVQFRHSCRNNMLVPSRTIAHCKTIYTQPFRNQASSECESASLACRLTVADVLRGWTPPGRIVNHASRRNVL